MDRTRRHRGDPFARTDNVTFDGTAWTQNISHAEMIRSGIDQTLTIDPYNLRATCTRAPIRAPPSPLQLSALTARPAGPDHSPLPPLEEHSETDTAHRKHSLGSRRGPGVAGVPGVGRADPV